MLKLQSTTWERVNKLSLLYLLKKEYLESVQGFPQPERRLLLRVLNILKCYSNQNFFILVLAFPLNYKYLLFAIYCSLLPGFSGQVQVHA